MADFLDGVEQGTGGGGGAPSGPLTPLELAAQLSTGIIAGGLLTANVDTTKLDISDGSGSIIDTFTDPENPTYTSVSWTGLTAITPTFAASNSTFIGLISNGSGGATVVQQTTDFTNTQRRDTIVLGSVGTPDGSNIEIVADMTHSVSSSYLSGDLSRALGRLTLDGHVFGDSGTNLTLAKSSGTTFEENISRSTTPKDPHIKTSGSTDPATWLYVHSDGAGGFTISDAAATSIDPDNRDDLSGTLQSVSGFTNQILMFFPDSEAILVQYGEQEYGSLEDAVADALVMDITQLDPSFSNDVVRSILSIKEGVTDIASAISGGEAAFSQTSMFGHGGIGGGGGGTFQTLQEIWNNSSDPEITTDVPRGAFSLKRGTASDGDDVFEVLNGAGTQVFAIKGDGSLVVDQYKELFIPAAAKTPDPTVPPAAGSEGTTALAAQDYYGYDDTTDEHAFFVTALPTEWDLGAISVRYYWTAGVNTGDVSWSVLATAISNDEDWNQTNGAPSPTTAPAPATVDYLTNDSVASGVVVMNTPSVNDLIRFRVSRDANNVADTMVGDARLIGIGVQYLVASTNPTGW